MNSNYRHFQLLILENDERVSSELAELIKGLNIGIFDIRSEKNFDRAFHILKDGKFDLIFLSAFSLSDESLLLKEIEKIYSLIPETPLAVVNSHPDPHLAEKCVQKGAEDCLSRLETGENQLTRCILHSVSRHRRNQDVFRKRAQSQFQGKLSAIGDFAQQTMEKVKSPASELEDQIDRLKKIDLDSTSLPELQSLLSSSEKFYSQIQEMLSQMNSISKDFSNKSDTKKELKILVVDDEEIYAELISERLKSKIDCKVDLAFDGNSAYEKCTESIQSGERFDLVISDMNMPEVSGLDLLEKIRNNPYISGIPFMMVTGVNEKESVQKAIDLKVTQYLIKPFKEKDFDEKVRRLRLILGA